jgi:hypothetical protein
MRNLLSVVYTGLLLAVLFATIAINGSRRQMAAVLPQQRSKRMEKLARLQTRDFHGEAGQLRAKQLRKLNKGVARAMKDASKRGLHEAFEHGRVILASDPEDVKSNSVVSSGPSNQLSVMRPASYRFNYPQDTFTDGEYEVTFIPYDDGDPNSWEGIVYRYDPDWGEDIRFGVLDISADEPQVTQETYYPSDGGDPELIDPNRSPLLGANRSSCESASNTQTPQYQKVGAVTQGMCGHCPLPNRCCLRLRDECCSPLPPLKPWFTCASKACLGTALGCSRTGPAFGECWGLSCTGAMLMCLI